MEHKSQENRLIFVKWGGSLITNKHVKASFRKAVARRLAKEVLSAIQTNDQLQLVLGHGSGSFGHFAASRFGTINGVRSWDEWYGFTEVSIAASELNLLVAQTLLRAGVPVWKAQPSASTICRDGQIIDMALEPIYKALKHKLVPLVNGDVAFDELRGGTIISTEKVFSYLAQHLPVTSILLLGEVEGVYDHNGSIIDKISPTNFQVIKDAIAGSSGTDVTGGMLTKVTEMLAIASAKPSLNIRIMSGLTPELLYKTLLQEAYPGTLISAS